MQSQSCERQAWNLTASLPDIGLQCPTGYRGLTSSYLAYVGHHANIGQPAGSSIQPAAPGKVVAQVQAHQHSAGSAQGVPRDDQAPASAHQPGRMSIAIHSCCQAEASTSGQADACAGSKTCESHVLQLRRCQLLQSDRLDLCSLRGENRIVRPDRTPPMQGEPARTCSQAALAVGLVLGPLSSSRPARSSWLCRLPMMALLAGRHAV